MRTLPSGWAIAKLADLAAAQPRAMTDGPFGSNLKTSHYTASGPRVIRLQNIGDGVFKYEDAHISEDHYETLMAHSVQAGDLIVASLGADLPRACLVPADIPPAIVKADCIRIRLHDAIDKRYVNYALQRPELRHAVEDQIHGVGRPRLGMTGIKGLSIPLAPQGEQKRIVEIIEEHFSRIDGAVSALLRIQNRIEVFQRSVVDATFSRMNAVDQESGSDLFPYITSGSRGWARYYSACGPSFIRVGNVPRSGIRLDLSDVQKVEPPAGVEGRRTKVLPNDVLVTITADIGRVAVATEDVGEAYINQHVAIARPRRGVSSDYLAWFISSASGQAQLRGLQRGVTKAGLGLDDIRSLRIPLPRPDAQDSIATKLSALKDSLDMQAYQAARQIRRSEAFRSAILAAAFRGQLTRQCRSDEPASFLLDQIQAERSATVTHRRKRTS